MTVTNSRKSFLREGPGDRVGSARLSVVHSASQRMDTRSASDRCAPVSLRLPWPDAEKLIREGIKRFNASKECHKRRRVAITKR